MHIHVLADGNHRGFVYFVDDAPPGLNARSTDAWCAPGETICATAFTSVAGPDNYSVGLLNSEAGYNRVKVNVTEIRVGTTDYYQILLATTAARKTQRDDAGATQRRRLGALDEMGPRSR